MLTLSRIGFQRKDMNLVQPIRKAGESKQVHIQEDLKLMHNMHMIWQQMDLVAFWTKLLHEHIKDPLLGVMKCNLLIEEIR
ncbi:hypothetical protein CsSME_00016580 [Camellia sinensis var. sinensis]